MDLAIKMSDERTLGVDPQQDRLKDASNDINNGRGRELLQLMNKVMMLYIVLFPITNSDPLSYFCFTHAPHHVTEQCIDTISGDLFSTMLFVFTWSRSIPTRGRFV